MVQHFFRQKKLILPFNADEIIKCYRMVDSFKLYFHGSTDLNPWSHLFIDIAAKEEITIKKIVIFSFRFLLVINRECPAIKMTR